MNQNKFESRNDKNYFKYDQYGNNPMPPLGPIGLIGLKGARDFSNLVNGYLVQRREEYLETAPEAEDSIGFMREDYHIPVNTFRFSSGEGKAVIENTIRGHDLYLLCDVTNYTATYNLRGIDNHMSPDDHYQDLKRVILAASGKARRINVIMPYLYEGRQHRRNARESLDCANMLIELTNLGVSNFITFDAHDDRVANAAPTSGFENVPITYQVLKALFNRLPDFTISPEDTMVVSPDEGAIYRSMYYSSMLGLPLGTFYKRRDYTVVKNGRNPIIAHEFLGDSVEGKDLLVIDDMISSGESMIELARKLKERGARKIFCIATFGLFTDGLQEFDRAYEDGVINNVLCTNLIYRSPELLAAPWYIDVNMAKFVALLIDAMNHNASISSLIDPTLKINALLENRRNAGCDI
ncbi:MAG: ribose-phosphate pyrophosphokinase [Eubacteriales bacterium]|nr:ribose-phosphate pyrophosphokinase [Eubacteriales bacterium]MDD4324247.1 ribose-phosphate pyrophosphokinase [Eubacteriales bacterium]MDD4541530.1 ribose-phosphate pyrophosphokinase [Eubacteriales bacterium]